MAPKLRKHPTAAAQASPGEVASDLKHRREHEKGVRASARTAAEETVPALGVENTFKWP